MLCYWHFFFCPDVDVTRDVERDIHPFAQCAWSNYVQAKRFPMALTGSGLYSGFLQYPNTDNCNEQC